MDAGFLVRGQEFFSKRNLQTQPPIHLFHLRSRITAKSVIALLSLQRTKPILLKRKQCSLQNNQDFEYDNVIQASRLD